MEVDEWKELALTVGELVHASLQVGACGLGARSDGHRFAVKVVGWGAGLEDVRSHVLADKLKKYKYIQTLLFDKKNTYYRHV